MVDALLRSGLSHDLITLLVAALPVLELRGALPLAINVLDVPWPRAVLFSVIGNMLPVPVLLLFFDSLARLLSRLPLGRRLVDSVLARTRRHSERIRRYERVGLTLFVSIPLPFTGAWTGSIAAFLLGLRFRYSLLSIFFGVLIAATVVTSLSLIGWLGAAIAGAALATVIILGWRGK